MFKVLIEDLKIKTIIGILEEERHSPQPLVINAQILYKRDEGFIDYAMVCEMIEDILSEGKFYLLEDALEEIAYALKKEYNQIKELNISIKKPTILKNALVGVEILRKY
ncbi:MAG: dihydroneopterin aldolase [Epsilonproteobacteria bacterium]|nr:dihydroneopterin aldolase [Campylobacterota bacterium]